MLLSFTAESSYYSCLPQVLNFANESKAKYRLKCSTPNLDLIWLSYSDHYLLTDTGPVLFAEFNPMPIFCHMRSGNMSQISVDFKIFVLVADKVNTVQIALCEC